MSYVSKTWQERCFGIFPALLVVALALLLLKWQFAPHGQAFLRIYDLNTGQVYVEQPAKPGDKVYFGWLHSLENIPWDEYYHIDEKLNLVLDAITFPAFGAGIPESKGRVCYIKDGLIHMEEIAETFRELVWLNSHTATRDIRLDGRLAARGRDLPQHVRLRLVIERDGAHGAR